MSMGYNINVIEDAYKNIKYSNDLDVYMAMLILSCGGKNQCYASLKTISETTCNRVSVRTVSDCIKRLLSVGIIKKEDEKTQKGCVKYNILIKRELSKLESVAVTDMRNSRCTSAKSASEGMRNSQTSNNNTSNNNISINTPKRNSFHNFEQRDYDYDDLEKRLRRKQEKRTQEKSASAISTPHDAP